MLSSLHVISVTLINRYQSQLITNIRNQYRKYLIPCSILSVKYTVDFSIWSWTMKEKAVTCWVWASHSGGDDYDEHHLQKCNAVKPGGSSVMFWQNVLAFHLGSLLGLLFDHEDGCSTFLWNASELYWTTWCYIPEDSAIRNSITITFILLVI